MGWPVFGPPPWKNYRRRGCAHLVPPNVGWMQQSPAVRRRAILRGWPLGLERTHASCSDHAQRDVDSPLASAFWPSRVRGPRFEIFFRDARQLFEEGDNRPDFPVRHLDETEARHAGHVNAVLDDPEQFLWLALVDELLEVGWIGAQAFREFGPFHARRSVAVDTTAL